VHEKLVELAAYEKKSRARLKLHCKSVHADEPAIENASGMEIDVYSCWSQRYEDDASRCILHWLIWRAPTRPNWSRDHPRPLWGLDLEGWSISSPWPANDNRRRLRRCTASELGSQCMTRSERVD